MKINSLYMKFAILLPICLTLLCTEGYSQGTESRRTFANKDKLYLGILLNPSKTIIANDEFSSTIPLNSKKGNGLNLALDFGYFFSKMVGINSGIGFSSNATVLSMASYTTRFQTTDSDEESYEMQISGKSIVENQKISFLSIPVCLIFRLPVSDNLGFYLKGGISFDIPVTKVYKGTGTFTYNGYYEVYPILLQNLPAYGFPSNLPTEASGTLQIKPLNTSLISSAGVYFSLNASLQLFLGVQFNKSLSSISAYKPDSNYHLTSKAEELNSLMAGCSNAGVQALGLSLGVKYYLR